MTISNELAEEIQQDILEAEASEVQRQVSQTVPYALLQLIGVIHNKTTKNEFDRYETHLCEEDFLFVSSTLQGVLNLLGWEAVQTGVDDVGEVIVSLIPLGTGGDAEGQQEQESV